MIWCRRIHRRAVSGANGQQSPDQKADESEEQDGSPPPAAAEPIIARDVMSTFGTLRGILVDFRMAGWTGHGFGRVIIRPVIRILDFVWIFIVIQFVGKFEVDHFF